MPTPIVSKAHSVWSGTLAGGSGTVSLDSSNAASFDVNWKARSEGEGGTTTPEELIAAAHSACYTMALSNELAENGTPAQELNASASVSFSLDGGPHISGIALDLTAKVEGLDDAKFQELAAGAKEGCPVSKALAAVDITLTAKLA